MTDARERAAFRERFYDRIADEFDSVMNQYDLERRLAVVTRLLSRAALPPDSLILDLGCGTGPFTLATQRLGLRVVSVDIGVRLLRVARSKGVPLPTGADALRLPFRDATFDGVVSSECIEHTPVPRLAVAEAFRVLRRKGHLVLTCPNHAWHWAAVLASRTGMRPYQGLENWPTWRELEAWVSMSGGELISHEGLHAVPFNLPGAPRLLPRLDGVAHRFRRFHVNQCIHAQRQ